MTYDLNENNCTARAHYYQLLIGIEQLAARL